MVTLKLDPLPDTVFRDLDALPACTPDTAVLFFGHAEARHEAAKICRRCPLGPYGIRRGTCLDFYESHPELHGGGGTWGGKSFGGPGQDD